MTSRLPPDDAEGEAMTNFCAVVIDDEAWAAIGAGESYAQGRRGRKGGPAEPRPTENAAIANAERKRRRPVPRGKKIVRQLA